ncbi:hypothetical protein IT072_03430 [Leifsonia sp. ZF2019]|uniref:LuxR C-terminal-related transcriptional regulator n=1 Tax=Leifsonia sp. ZF2019 TaxID=2781978 RepID=UPI001CBCF7B6|nr:LuxR C-terminal-related transcriptional regulator [Leifsonia sp. ZF2019]UAJ80115.1 hypothetical protein IT072_03430 [Leifsonia sp. ZF2019]
MRERAGILHVPGIAPPSLPSTFLSRPRLASAIHGDWDVIVVMGPIGAGKTSLLAEWAHSPRENPTVWLPYVENREDFWRYLGELLGGSAHCVDDVVALVQASDIAATIVVDDVPGESADFFDSIRRLATSCPGIRMIVATSGACALSDLAAVADLDIRVIGPTDLMFTRSEAREVVTSLAGPHSADDVYLGDTVLPLGARLIGVAVERGTYGSFDWEGSGRSQVAEILVHKLIPQIPDSKLFTAVMRLSVAEFVDDELCRSLVGESSDDLLDELERLGLGYFTPAGAVRRFTIVPLLRQGYLKELHRRLPAEVQSLQRVTALWCLDKGRFAEALRNAVDIEDYYLASRIARAGWAELTGSFLSEATTILARRDRTKYMKFPVLATLAGLGALRHSRDGEASVHFEDALSALRRTGAHAQADVIWTSTLRAVCRMHLGSSALAARAAQRAVAEFEQLARRTRDELGNAGGLLMKECSIVLLFAGLTTEAGAAARLGMRWADGTSITANQLRLVEAVAWALDGHIDASLMLVAQPFPSGLGLDHLESALRVIVEAETGVLAAPEDLSLLRGLCRTSDWWTVSWALALHAMAQGSFDQGAATVAAALPAIVPESIGKLRTERMYGYLLMGSRRPGRADELIARFARRDDETSLLRAVRFAQSGRYSEALEQTAVALSATNESNPRVGATAAMLAAVCASELLMTDLSHQFASRGVALASQHHLLSPLLVLSAGHREEFRRFLQSLPGDQRSFPAGSWLSEQSTSHPLTRRERAVLAELLIHETRADLAESLGVSINTVKTQLRSLYRKLGASDRRTAIVRALESGIITASEKSPARPIGDVSGAAGLLD